MSMIMNPNIFREYDIRGVVGTDFNEDFARKLGEAFVSHIAHQQANLKQAPIITVGQDARVSSPSISAALCEGLVAAGAQVVRLGLITTPMSYFSMFSYPGAIAGVMVTGSHNPANYNGFKISLGKTTIYGAEIQKLRERIEAGIPRASQQELWKGSLRDYDIYPDYIQRQKNEFNFNGKTKVVLDCGNGAAGPIARRLYEAVGLKPVVLFEEPDGRFPNHHPDPTVEENMIALRDRVLKEGAICGIGFDGDADRIGVVDHTGRFLYGDELMVLISRDLLKKHPGATIVGDVKCSDRLYEDISKNGGKPDMWKTGHSLIKMRIKEMKAPFGGELSGHFFFADRNEGYDDAPYAGLRLLEILEKTGKTIPQLLAELPPAVSTPEIRVDTTDENKWRIVEHLKQVFSRPSTEYKLNTTDGVRLSFSEGWALARASNTQPVLVLRFEAQSEGNLKVLQKRLDDVIQPML